MVCLPKFQKAFRPANISISLLKLYSWSMCIYRTFQMDAAQWFDYVVRG